MATKSRTPTGEGKPKQGSSSHGSSIQGKPTQGENILERQQPCNIQAELAVLGSILLLPQVADDVALVIRADDFYDDSNRLLYEHFHKMFEQGRRIDETLLVDSLKRTGDYQKIGGAAYLVKVGEAVSTAAHAVHYAQIVRDLASCRSLIEASTSILHDAYYGTSEPDELLASAEQRIFSILDSRNSNSVSSIRDILLDAMHRIDARMRGEHDQGGVVTGFTDLDNMTGGLHNSELVVLAARPGMGKTALAMNIAEHVAMVQRVPVLFVSLEMSAIELADRMLCSRAKVNSHRLRSGSISKQDREQLVEVANEISEGMLFVDDSPSRTVTEIAAAARRIRRREKALGLVVIDYLQLIEPDNSKDPRQEQVAKITRRLKGLAREMEVPVICLAQLNRQTEAAKENRPRLSHLRESGAIEQDADVVLFVHREEYFRNADEREEVAGQAELMIAKQRNGPVGEVPLVWRKEFTRFENATVNRYDEFDQFNASPSEPF